MRTRNVMLAALAAIAIIVAADVHAACGESGVAVQILGSGGPVADDGRASAGSLVWIDGHARLLVDVGGGVFLRFGESGARLEDLQAIAITHFHADHSADLPALIKSGFFSDRSLPLTISGPGAGGEFPSLRDFLSAQFDSKHGAFRYLSGALDGSGGQFKLEPVQIPADTKQPLTVINTADVVVEAIGVPHGPVPALAYRIETRGLRIVFSGDQNGSNPEFWRFAENADVLVMTLAVPEDADPVARKLHAPPSVIGKGAATAHVRNLVLSHLMARSLKTLDDNLAIIHRAYQGPILVAKDLMCVPVNHKQ